MKMKGMERISRICLRDSEMLFRDITHSSLIWFGYGG